MASRHEEAVRRISGQLEQLHRRGEPFTISTKPLAPRLDGNVVDTSELCEVIDANISPSTSTVSVEPSVTMNGLVTYTLARHNMIPQVVTPFPDTTVGEAFLRGISSSSSFKFGPFSHTVTSIEMVLYNGEVIVVTERVSPGLLRVADGTLEELGVLTKLEIRLCPAPAKTFVEVTYRPFSILRAAIVAIEMVSRIDELDFVDGIIFSPTHAVVVTARLANYAPSPDSLATFWGPWDPWFYLHVQAKRQDDISTEYLRLESFLFRYDQGAFWLGKDILEKFGCPWFNRYTRWLFSDLMRSRVMFDRTFRGLDMLPGATVEDFVLRSDRAERMSKLLLDDFGIRPLWICPSNTDSRPKSPAGWEVESRIMVNLGIRGCLDDASQQREVETQVKKLEGWKLPSPRTALAGHEFRTIHHPKELEAFARSATTYSTGIDKEQQDTNSQVRQRRPPAHPALSNSAPSSSPSQLTSWQTVLQASYLSRFNLVS